jgi:hypothetical protein
VNTTRVAYRRGRLLRRYERAFIGWLRPIAPAPARRTRRPA